MLTKILKKIKSIYDPAKKYNVREYKNKLVISWEEDSVTKNIWTKAQSKDLDRRFDEMKTYVDHRFDEIKTYVDKRFDDFKEYVDKRFDEMKTYVDKRFDDFKEYVDKRFDEVNARIDRIETKLDEVIQMLKLIISLPTIQKEIKEK